MAFCRVDSICELRQSLVLISALSFSVIEETEGEKGEGERETERERDGGRRRKGGEREKLMDFKVMKLRRDQNPERCSSQHPHKVFQNRATVYIPEADIKACSTNPY